MSNVGCALTALAEIACLLGVTTPGGAPWTPLLVNDRGRTCDPPAFAKGSAAAVLPLVGSAIGVTVADRQDVRGLGADDVRATIKRCLDNGGALLGHVDHDEDKAGGDFDGDHWVTICSLDSDDVTAIDIIDPVDGRQRFLAPHTLQGPSPFGVARPYRLRAVRACFPMAPR